MNVQEVNNSVTQTMLKGAVIQNEMLAYQSIIDYLVSLCVSRFNWDIPQEITTNNFAIEYTLFNSGYVAFIHSEYGNYILPCTIRGYNFIYDPIEITTTSVGNMNSDNITNLILNKTFTPDNFVICYNSLQRKPTGYYLNYLITDLATTMVTMSSLFKKCRQPYIFKTDDKKQFNDKILMNQILNKDIIFCDTDKTLDVLTLGINSDNFEHLQNHFDDLMRRLHGILGISYNVDPKKERMLVDEISTNENVKELFSESLLKARLNFCEEIKNRFGLDISVSSVV